MKDNVFIFKKGSYLYIEEDGNTDNIFIVKQGAIQIIYRNHRLKDIEKIAGPGDILGFVSSLCGKPRMESALVIEDSSVIVLSKDRFMDKLRRSSDMAFRVLRYFAQQLREYDELITFGNSPGNQPVPQSLLQTGSFYYEMGNADIAYYILSRLVKYYGTDPAANSARTLLNKMANSVNKSMIVPARYGIYRVFADKQIIFCENEPGDELFIIKKGRVKIVKQSNNSEVVLSVLGDGEIFGELAIVSHKPRNATAISMGKTTALPIDMPAITKLIEKSPLIINRIFTAISRRVWFTRIRFDTLTYNHLITKMYVFLKNKLLEENISLRDTNPYNFAFGIDELQKMAGHLENDDSVIKEMFSDPNLRFQLGSITVLNPKVLAATAHYYAERDNADAKNVRNERFLFHDANSFDNETVNDANVSEKPSILSEIDDFDFTD